MHSNKQGTGLFVVLIIVTALAFGIYSVSDLINSEFRLNKRAEAHHEARQAVESLIQSSIADLRSRFDSTSAFTADILSPSRNPLSISVDFIDYYTAEDPKSNLVFDPQSTEVVGSRISSGEWTTINPLETGNEYDELGGMRVLKRTVEVFGKATVNRLPFGDLTVHASQYLEIRDVPLFAYAIYYNLPLEIAPGAPMDVYGNVHVNSDAWLQSSKGLNFHGNVTIAGDLHHGRHPDSGKDDSNGSVNIANDADDLVSMKENGTWPDDAQSGFPGGWLESLYENFVDIALQVWDGNLKTKDHGVLTQNLAGVKDYIEDTNPDEDGKQSYNSAYPIIQPVLNENELSIPGSSLDPDDYAAEQALKEVEKQKYAYKAGLTIQVNPDGSLRYFSYAGEGDLSYGGDGNPVITELTPTAEIASYKPFSLSGNNVESGLHDKRQAKDLDIIELDISKLKDSLHNDNEGDQWGGNAPKSWWNGIVYVEFPQENESSNRDDNVNPAQSDWGLKLVNGETIPNPNFAHSKDIYGTSIATNQMMYVEGHYNADGDKNTGSPTEPDDPANFAKEGYEAPAALIADSITFLSENWSDADSTKGLNSRIAADTEISAAVLTGLIPSGKTGSSNYSGGVENFPRFLEKWSGKEIRIRGSMVALFESEVGVEGWGKGGVYSAPNRAWGFHQSFGEGLLPPGTPVARNYRGRDLQLLSDNEYNNRVSLNWP